MGALLIAFLMAFLQLVITFLQILFWIIMIPVRLIARLLKGGKT